MSKFARFGGYPEESLMLAEAALLTAWRSLDRYHNDLVLTKTARSAPRIFIPATPVTATAFDRISPRLGRFY